MSSSAARRIRVSYVIDSLVPGGAERSLADVAAPLRERNVQLEVIYLHERPGLHDELRSAGVKLSSAAGPGGRLGWVRRISKLLTPETTDLVHTTLFEANITGRLAARRKGIPAVTSIVNDSYGSAASQNAPRLRLAAARLADVQTIQRAVRVHAVSALVADATSEHLRYPAERIEVVYRGRDPLRLGERNAERRAVARASLGIASDALVILAVARTEPQKGLDALIEAMTTVAAQHPHAKLIIAGRAGRAQEQLDDLTVHRGLTNNVRFLGQRDDIGSLHCAADIFALPSRWEGLPGAALEAMCLETPIVASDIPQVREVLGNAGGVLVPPDSPEMLADAMLHLDHDPAAARVEALRKRFLSTFTIEAAADGMRAFYEGALSSPTS